MNERQHTIEVPNVGAFTFRRRVMRDEFKIGAEYSRLTEGVATPSQWLDMFATAFSTLKTLTAEAGALRAAEARFRSGSGAVGEGVGAGAGGNNPALVSPPVQPTGQ